MISIFCTVGGPQKVFTTERGSAAQAMAFVATVVSFILYRYRLQIINPRRACASVIVVVLSVCLSLCLLSHISPLERLFFLKNAVKYSVCNVGRNICGIFSETVSFRSYCTSCIDGYSEVGHFSLEIRA